MQDFSIYCSLCFELSSQCVMNWAERRWPVGSHSLESAMVWLILLRADLPVHALYRAQYSDFPFEKVRHTALNFIQQHFFSISQAFHDLQCTFFFLFRTLFLSLQQLLKFVIVTPGHFLEYHLSLSLNYKHGQFTTVC